MRSRILGILLGGGIISLAGCSSGVPDRGVNTSQGRIIFRSRAATDLAGTGALYAINPDGSGRVTLANSFTGKTISTISTDGTKLAMPTAALSATILWLNIDSGVGHTVSTPHPTASVVSWMPDSKHVIYAPSGALPYAIVALDGSSIQELANDIPLVFSANGTKEAYLAAYGAFNAGTGLFVANADGTGSQLISDTTDYFAPIGAPQFSADGGRVAYVYGKLVQSGAFYVSQLMVRDLNSGSSQQLTNSLGDVGIPSWSPDGTHLSFSMAANLFVIKADGTGKLQLTTGSVVNRASTWLPDGKRLAFIMNDDVFIINADGTGLTNLTNSASIEYDLHWVPK